MKLLNHFLLLNTIPLVCETALGIIVNNNNGVEKTLTVLSAS